MGKKNKNRDEATKARSDEGQTPLPQSSPKGEEVLPSAKAMKAHAAAMGRENRIVATDGVTAQELIDAGLAVRSEAGDVYAVEKEQAEA
jgi:hypothetical protein